MISLRGVLIYMGKIDFNYVIIGYKTYTLKKKKKRNFSRQKEKTKKNAYKGNSFFASWLYFHREKFCLRFQVFYCFVVLFFLGVSFQ